MRRRRSSRACPVPPTSVTSGRAGRRSSSSSSRRPAPAESGIGPARGVDSPTRRALGADGAWWLLQSSKLARPDDVGLGGFDSHTLPPARPHLTSCPVHLRLLAGFVVAALAVAPEAVHAQRQDSTRAGAQR